MQNIRRENENFKITVIDDYENGCCGEIRICRTFIYTLILGFLSAEKSSERLNEQFNEREKEILRLAAKGQKNNEIADNLHISIYTVKMYIKNIFEKLNVHDRTEAVVKAVKYSLIDVFN